MILPTLYWGTNPFHEFWQSENSEILILRNHGEAFWSAHKNLGFLFFAASAEEAAKRLSATFDQTRKWVKSGERYRLVPSIPSQQSDTASTSTLSLF